MCELVEGTVTVPLVGVEDLGPAMPSQSFFQGLDTERRLQAD